MKIGLIAVHKTSVRIESDSKSGKWMARTARSKDGGKTVIFFRRSRRQSFFQPLIDMVTGVTNGKAAAEQHLQGHGMSARMSTADMDAKMQVLIASPDKARRRTAQAPAPSTLTPSATTTINKLIYASNVEGKENLAAALRLADVALNSPANYTKSVPPGLDIKKGIALLERFSKYQLREDVVQRAELLKLIDALTTENNRATPKLL
jgi:hypothetical protein